MSAGIVFLCVYMLIGAVLMCLSILMHRRHPDHPAAREMRGSSTQEAVAGFMLSCLAWPWMIYIIWKKGKRSTMSVSSQHMMNRCGITYRMLDYWTRAGYLKLEPDEDGRTGSGVNRMWPESEVPVATAMARLTAEGLAVNRAALIARYGEPDTVLALLATQPRKTEDDA